MTPAGIPPIESPVFEQWAASLDEPTRRVANDLRQKGYAVFDFPEADFDSLVHSIIQDLHDRYDWAGWRAGSCASLRVREAWSFHPAVRRIATNPRILDLLARLYGRKAFPFQTLNFAVGTQQELHSDAVHFHSVPERFMCGVWVAFEDITLDNGPLLYYPGSHQWPIYTYEHLGINPDGQSSPYEHYGQLIEWWRRLVAAKGLAPERFLARKGQALIWCANLLHGGDKVLDTARTRHSQVTHYYFEDCCYYTPLESYPMYGRILFREPDDVSTGAKRINQAAGKPVPSKFLRATRPPLRKIPTDFDPARYLRFHPDVARAGVDPAEHYLKFGHAEGRAYR